MNNIVLFYSRSGNTKLVATKIAEILNCEIEEIIDYKNRSGILGWILSGRDAFRKKLTEIKPVTKNLILYDNIIIGTPVWAGNISPAVRTFVKNYCDKFKSVSFFCTMGGSGSKRVFNELELLCQKQPLKKLAITQREIFSGDYIIKIKKLFL
jgi:flavodoxin